MEIVHTIKDLQAGLSAMRAQGKKVGLVPTMGALHAGHASLVKRCVAENDAAVVSVFVNPTQFNDQNDLIKYPRTPEADCRLLEECGAAFVFAPAVEEMYPEPDTRQFSYAPLDTVMEGAFRPGHFNGVCQIVSKLFVDGGFGFSTAKVKGSDAANSWNIGLKPGLAIKLSDRFCLVAKYGFLGYSQDETPMGTKTKNFGLDLDTDELSFGFHYIF